jgi:translation elongation factor EF-1alpha
MFVCYSTQITCKFQQLIQRTDRRCGKKVIEASEWFQKNDAAIGTVVLKSHISSRLSKNKQQSEGSPSAT